ncbi:MAG: cytochrome c3 family protein [Desulfuromonadales bacterium]|nr:cytochrome c3 family protein [Desulfuromonadales bacterium]
MKRQMLTLFLVITAVLVAVTVSLAAPKVKNPPATPPEPVDVNVVTKGSIVTITAEVKNPERAVQKAGIVNVTATDSAGRLVANLGMPVVVLPKSSLTVSREWKAPSYATPLTWKAKVVAYREPAMDHVFGWKFPGLQHRMTADAKNPMSCTTCHDVTLANRDAGMSCYNCHGKKWN